MHFIDQFHECLTVAQSALHPNESIVQFCMAKPETGRLDQSVRFKVYAGVFDKSSGAFAQKRCFVVTTASPSGKVAIDTSVGCNAIVDVW
jgi:hypothetical protein